MTEEIVDDFKYDPEVHYQDMPRQQLIDRIHELERDPRIEEYAVVRSYVDRQIQEPQTIIEYIETLEARIQEFEKDADEQQTVVQP